MDQALMLNVAIEGATRLQARLDHYQLKPTYSAQIWGNGDSGRYCQVVVRCAYLDDTSWLTIVGEFDLSTSLRSNTALLLGILAGVALEVIEASGARQNRFFAMERDLTRKEFG